MDLAIDDVVVFVNLEIVVFDMNDGRCSYLMEESFPLLTGQ